ncbi:hypothetical protein QQS21_009525 [Conoideocrella luteorostrata]|uniref:Short chain dehydrogenase n=1 Tax=Conoideocrella luteorostrata TaxID=1105319 RepID=A0AAJ0FQB2_9HYPO|nr:hypothetical protein QQS21_009525 [Conoideocrella luteorostrata]
MSSKVVLVTGANTGLGLEIVRALCGSDANYEILLGGRSLEKATKAVQNVIAAFPKVEGRVSAIQVDIEDDDSISAAVDTVSAKYGHLDVLVNNAGGQFDQHFSAGKMTMRQVWHQSWSVNTASTQIMTANFVPLLLKSSDPRLLFITSGTSTLQGAENLELPINRVPQKGWPKSGPAQSSIPAYRSAKTGMNMMMREWYRILKEDGVKVWCVSPGYLATGLGGSLEQNQKQGAQDPSLGGQFVKDVVEGQRDGDVGKVILREGKIQPW